MTAVMDIERAKNKYEGKMLRKVRFDNHNRIPFIRLFSTDSLDDALDRIHTDEIVLCLSISDKSGYWRMECVSPRGRRGFMGFSTFMWEVVEESC